MTQEDIILTAFQVWGRNFYKQTSLTDIARALGVSKPALYRHFKSKTGLLDALYEYFFRNYAAFIKPFYDKAASAQKSESLLIIAQAVTEYYAKNEYYFMFSLIQVYGSNKIENMLERLQEYGIVHHRFGETPLEDGRSVSLKFIIASIMFIIAHFHRSRFFDENPASDEEIASLIRFTMQKVAFGLGFDKEKTLALDYTAAEKKAESIAPMEENCPLLKAVASAIAGSGLWDVSMNMVAQKSGLSKSGLYSHFTNKEDMIKKLFTTEFEKIISLAEQAKALSDQTEERLYLIIIAIADYFRRSPDILAALDLPRMKKIYGLKELKNQKEKMEYVDMSSFYALFSGMLPSEEPYAGFTPQLLLFLIIDIFIHGDKIKSLEKKGEKEKMEKMGDNESFRKLYQFITLGIS